MAVRHVLFLLVFSSRARAASLSKASPARSPPSRPPALPPPPPPAPLPPPPPAPHARTRHPPTPCPPCPRPPSCPPPCPPPLHSDPETERYRLFDAVTAWLAAASAEVPLLVVLDDLQWAAKPTLLLLRHVVRSAETMRLLVLCTYRDSELVHDHPLIEVI